MRRWPQMILDPPESEIELSFLSLQAEAEIIPLQARAVMAASAIRTASSAPPPPHPRPRHLPQGRQRGWVIVLAVDEKPVKFLENTGTREVE
jgi:hypothetical protein